MRKAIVAGALSLIAALSLGACSGGSTTSGSTDSTSLVEEEVEEVEEEAEETATSQEETVVTVRQSPDKYTWYIKNYVGMNAASVGYESLSGFRYDSYGSGALKIIFVASDGTYIDPGNEEQLKEYKVTAQSYAPDTEMKYEFEVDSEGEEYDNLVSFSTIDEIVLAVSKVGSTEDAPALTQIQVAPDRYTEYVRDYVGRNLAECGYYSLGGNYVDAYGNGYIYLDIVADDGSYVDPEDEAVLASYMVTSQSVEPNTEIQMTYLTDSDGNEYSNLIDTQTIESITLYVTAAPDSGYPVGEDASE